MAFSEAGSKKTVENIRKSGRLQFGSGPRSRWFKSSLTIFPHARNLHGKVSTGGKGAVSAGRNRSGVAGSISLARRSGVGDATGARHDPFPLGVGSPGKKMFMQRIHRVQRPRSRRLPPKRPVRRGARKPPATRCGRSCATCISAGSGLLPLRPKRWRSCSASRRSLRPTGSFVSTRGFRSSCMRSSRICRPRATLSARGMCTASGAIPRECEHQGLPASERLQGYAAKRASGVGGTCADADRRAR